MSGKPWGKLIGIDEFTLLVVSCTVYRLVSQVHASDIYGLLDRIR